MGETILVVGQEDANAALLDCLQHKLQYKVRRVQPDGDIMRLLLEEKSSPLDIVLLDLQALGARAENVIRTIKASRPLLPVIVLTAYGAEESIEMALRAGATDFLTKPVMYGRLGHTLQLVLKIKRMGSYMGWLERRMAGHVDFSDIIGEHPQHKEALRIAQQTASSKISVWISGEEGTGKELFARAIHGGSDRAGKAFVVVDCESLLMPSAEAKLFGQNSSDGGLQFILGKLREADHGTLLLKEVTSLPTALHERLLAFLETGMIAPLGSGQKVKLDVRVIATVRNNKDTQHSDQKLYRHLRSATIALPPLSARAGDIQLLAEHFIAIHAATEQKYVRGFTPAALEWLKTQSWPGNIHQLSQKIWRAVVMSQREWIDSDDIMSGDGRALQPGSTNHGLDAAGQMLLDNQGKVKTLKSVQEEAIRFALQYSGGCMTRAAKSLGIGRSTLYRKLDEYDIENYISRANQTTRPMTNVSSMERS